MRKYFQAVAVGAVVAVSFSVYAADTLDVKPESRAYLNFDFGGSREQTHELHYGLQFGQRAEYNRDREILRPASAIKFDYSNVGNNLLVNGRPLAARATRLNQTEGAAAAEAAAPAAEEPGFFGKIGNWFGNLFGGGDDAAAAAPAAETTAATEPGFFDSYTIADYALLGVGIVGVGYAISEVAKSDDSPDPAAGGSGNPPPSGGGTCLPGDPTGVLCLPSGGGGPAPPGGGGLPNCLPGDPTGELCLPLTGNESSAFSLKPSVQYLEWLDGGTGQMGDLVAQ